MSTSNVFKIVPVAYTNKSTMDNSVLWNNKVSGGTSLILNRINEYGEEEANTFQAIKELDSTDLNTEYFNLKGQYLIMSQAPIPKNSKAYMEIEIYSHPRLIDIRHLAISVGVHKNPFHGVLIDDFCMGNVYYTSPYRAKNPEETEGDILFTGSKRYLPYVVTERYGLNIYKEYQFKQPASKNIDASKNTTSPPLLYNTIGLGVDMAEDKITIYVNGHILYSFRPNNFTLSNFEEESTPAYLKKIDTSSFYFAMYTHLINAEIEGLFNLGKNNIKYLPEGYSSLFDLYNTNDNSISLDTFNKQNSSINTDLNNDLNKAQDAICNGIIDETYISNKITIYFNDKSKREPEFIYNNNNYTYISINKSTNKIISDSDLKKMTESEIKNNIIEIYIGKKFYTSNINTYWDLVNKNLIIEYPEENKSAFNFYNRKYPFIDMDILPSDLAILRYPIPVEQEIYFEFKCMYGFINSKNYEGLPLYIGLATFDINTIGGNDKLNSNSNTWLNSENMLKIALFRKKISSENNTGTGFKIYKYINNEKFELGSIQLKNPLLIEQGAFIGIRINLKNRLLTIYNKDYEFGSIEIPEDLNFHITPTVKIDKTDSSAKTKIIYGEKNDAGEITKIMTPNELPSDYEDSNIITYITYENESKTSWQVPIETNTKYPNIIKLVDDKYFKYSESQTLPCYFFFEVEDVNVLKAKSNIGYVLCNFGGDTNLQLVNNELIDNKKIMTLYSYYNTSGNEEIILTSGVKSYSSYYYINFTIDQKESQKYSAKFIISFKIGEKSETISADLNTLFNTDTIITDKEINHNNYPTKSIIDIQAEINNDNNKR